MALRLRRGTDAERLIMEPPAAGELIYTTDTKAVYVGDGTTVGGLPVSGQALGIDDLGNVTITAPNDNDILKWNGTAWINVPQESLEKPGNIYGTDSTLLIDTDNSVIVGPIVANTPIIGDVVGDITGNLTGDVVGDVVGTLTGNVIGTLDGDVTGSVFGDDSSPIVDAISREITAFAFNSNTLRTDTSDTFQIRGYNGLTGELSTRVAANEGAARIILSRESTSNLAGDQASQYGTIIFERNDSVGNLVTSVISSGESALALANNSSGWTGLASETVSISNGKLGIRKYVAAEALDVEGNALVSGFIQFGSLTTAERDALTAANGMVIYNSTDNKFQGYENGAWVNLV